MNSLEDSQEHFVAFVCFFGRNLFVFFFFVFLLLVPVYRTKHVEQVFPLVGFLNQASLDHLQGFAPVFFIVMCTCLNLGHTVVF